VLGWLRRGKPELDLESKGIAFFLWSLAVDRYHLQLCGGSIAVAEIGKSAGNALYHPEQRLERSYAARR
jgi:hypothetical protein